MLWYIPDPFHTARLEFDIGIKPLGHSLVDDVLLLLSEQLYKLPLVANELINLRRFPIKKMGNLFALYQMA